MKFTLSWLSDHLATRKSIADLDALMLQAGLEVEAIDNPADRLAAFTVAKVKAVEPHPDPEITKVRVCTVDTVDGTLQILCGAPNARPGMTAIYAPLGTYIPGLDLALDKKPRKIKGVESHGMLCSLNELGLGEDSEGIADLPDSLPLGQAAADALGVNDPVVDFEVTPNRPDWLGVVGIARDLAATGAGRFVPRDIKPIPGQGDCPIEIRLDDSGACPIFAGVLIRGVRNGPSPDWMRRRLEAVGITPRSLLVDVTNYVSLDRARPLHAYDAAKLEGEVTARLAREGEMLEAIDGRTYALTPDMCVIADGLGPVGLGGIMGGTRTAVSEQTVDVFLESAWFDPLRIARTGRTTGIVSDARYRFERGVDPASCLDGLALATELILAHGGGTPTQPKLAGLADATPRNVTFKPADVARLTGLKVKPADMKRMLKDLGFAIEDAGDAWYLGVPSWRFDIEQSADLVEEIARLAGYDRLPVTSLPAPDGGIRAILSPAQDQVRRARRVMAARGFLETVTWSFMSRAEAEAFGGGAPELRVANPVASDLDQMRPSILPNLARAAQRAADRGERTVRLFEAGPIYLDDTPTGQHTVIAGLVRPHTLRHWSGPAGTYDSFAAKADLLAVLLALGHPSERFQIGAPEGDHWHPGQAATLKLGPKTVVAAFGALHPRTLRALDVSEPVYAFELDLAVLPQPKVRAKAGKTRAVLDVSDQTPVHRDLAFLVDETVPAGDLVRLARTADKTLISHVDVFDVYQGEGIAAGQKSIALELTLSPRGKALTDKDIDAVMDSVVKAVAKGTGATLRG